MLRRHSLLRPSTLSLTLLHPLTYFAKLLYRCYTPLYQAALSVEERALRDREELLQELWHFKLQQAMQGDTTQSSEPADVAPGDGPGDGRPDDAAPTRPGAPPAEILLLDVPSPPSVGTAGGTAGGGGGGPGGGGPAGTPALGLRASRSVLRLTQAVGRHRERTVGRDS